VRLERDARTGEVGMQFVSEDERLVGVMCLHNDLNHALKGVTPQHSKLDGTQGSPISCRREGSLQRPL
jgi:hypothetical protein